MFWKSVLRLWKAELQDYDETTSPNDWQVLNSPNHGGRGSGEGQNLLFADGHAEFVRKPIVGLDQDNVYTVMAGPLPIDRWVGGSPISYSGHGVPQLRSYPGQAAFENGQRDAVTDTVLYP